MSYDYGVQLSLDEILERFRNGDTPGEADFEQLIRLAAISRQLINDLNNQILQGLEVTNSGTLSLNLDETQSGDSGLSVSSQGLKLATDEQQKLDAINLNGADQKITLSSIEDIVIPLADTNNNGLMSSDDWNKLETIATDTGTGKILPASIDSLTSSQILLGALILNETDDGQGNITQTTVSEGELSLRVLIRALVKRARDQGQPFTRSELGLAE